jgi:Peptidase A4 family
MSTIQEPPAVRQPSSASESPYPPPTTPPVHRHRSRRGWSAAAVVLLLAALLGLATVPDGAPGHQLWTRFASTANAQADPQVAAIEKTIEQANAEQIQALQTNTPSVMADTGTAAYYRQLVQINQQLEAQGVTSIQLTDLHWGPITVNGTTATAQTTETWVTTLSDSTTSVSTDTNVYTLVQQNGHWVIEADQQPSGGQGVAPSSPGQARPTPLPAVPNSDTTSHNWSGYAATGGNTYTAVSGTWTVPQLAQNGAPGVGATWVGIGGVNSPDLIQAGTQDVGSGGQAQYQAWIEMLPAASQQVPLVVAPGDSVSVSITEQGPGSGNWQIVLKNNTSGQRYQATVQYASSQSSAEWIEEAPASQGGIVPLDNFGSVAFTAATTTENGGAVDIAQAGAQPIAMLNAANQPLAVPSPIGSDGSSFSVARTSASATPGNGRGVGRATGASIPGVGR